MSHHVLQAEESPSAPKSWQPAHGDVLVRAPKAGLVQYASISHEWREPPCKTIESAKKMGHLYDMDDIEDSDESDDEQSYMAPFKKVVNVLPSLPTASQVSAGVVKFLSEYDMSSAPKEEAEAPSKAWNHIICSADSMPQETNGADTAEPRRLPQIGNPLSGLFSKPGEETSKQVDDRVEPVKLEEPVKTKEEPVKAKDVVISASPLGMISGFAGFTGSSAPPAAPAESAVQNIRLKALQEAKADALPEMPSHPLLSHPTADVKSEPATSWMPSVRGLNPFARTDTESDVQQKPQPQEHRLVPTPSAQPDVLPPSPARRGKRPADSSMLAAPQLQ